MTKQRMLSSVPAALMLTVALMLAVTLGTSSASELKGRVSVPKGKGPAVVFLKGVKGGSLPKADAVITHVSGGKFEPAVTVGFVGNDFVFRNEDDTLHTTHTYDDRARTMFNVAIPVPGMTIDRPLRRPGVVRVECDSHGWMRGWIYVTDDMGVVSGPDGSFEITGVPPGSYELTIWHERFAGMSRRVTVTAGGAVEANFTLQ